MAEEKKRFPWWWLACAVLLVIFAAVMGFIETVGRQGTIVGRYEQIHPEMSRREVYAILGRTTNVWTFPRSAEGFLGPPDVARFCDDPLTMWEVFTWDDESPARVEVWFGKCRLSDGTERWRTKSKRLRLNDRRLSWWHFRRWTEKAHAAIHGPRR
jgi:hypothetical protein